MQQRSRRFQVLFQADSGAPICPIEDEGKSRGSAVSSEPPRIYSRFPKPTWTLRASIVDCLRDFKTVEIYSRCRHDHRSGVPPCYGLSTSACDLIALHFLGCDSLVHIFHLEWQGTLGFYQLQASLPPVERASSLSSPPTVSRAGGEGFEQLPLHQDRRDFLSRSECSLQGRNVGTDQ